MSYDEERMNRMKPVLDRIPKEWGKYLPEPGWDEILLELDRRLAEIDPSYTILQAKEKFGTLRVYVSASDGAEPGSTARMWEEIGAFEEWSARTCEYCGAPGKARYTGWIKTLCDSCNEEREARRA